MNGSMTEGRERATEDRDTACALSTELQPSWNREASCPGNSEQHRLYPVAS